MADNSPILANVEAEAAFIGAVLIENRLIEELTVSLLPAHFFEPVHQRIFERILALLDRNAVVTPVTLKPYFEADEALQELGGIGYLARLTADGQGVLAARELAEQVIDLARRRELIAASAGLASAARDVSKSLAEVRAIAAELLTNREGDASGVRASPYAWQAAETLPRRPWLYGRQFLRGSVFVVIAPGATGKSVLMAGSALAICTGRPLLGQQVWDGPQRVWLWNCEDSLTELQFSIQAASLHWGIGAGDIGGRLFVDSALSGAALKLTRAGRNGPTIDTHVAAQIIAELKRRQIDVLVIDPFVSSHGLADENDNAAVDLVAKEWSRIAAVAQCAIVLVHHARKLNGAEVTAESARGASALVDAARGGLALNTMAKVEAEKFGIPADQRRRFFRADDAKPNRAPAGTGQWFEIVSVQLGNGADGGDVVGVATPWSPPDPFADVSIAHLRAVQAKIADGEWRENVQAGDWAGKAVAQVLDLDTEEKPDRKRLAAILRIWIDNGALRVEERPDRNGDKRKFVIVGAPA